MLAQTSPPFYVNAEGRACYILDSGLRLKGVEVVVKSLQNTASLWHYWKNGYGLWMQKPNMSCRDI